MQRDETPGGVPQIRTVADVKALLRRYGILIYAGSPLDDLVLMELELEDLWEERLIDREEYLMAKTVIRQRRRDLSAT
ncbi:MAG: DUF910 family protein [Kyrpidia sp.]|nr:DUF910 family protein [Kyrpidia sp.]